MKIIGKKRIKTYSYYICECPYCKKIIDIRFDHYKTRKNDDCGCKKHLDARNGKHSKIYDIHQAMKQRCFNKNCYCYKRYGGRGITVCNEWLDYKTFKKWALNNGYSDNLDLDRIDNDGNYEPSNCRFIPHIENCNNRRTTIHQNINGKSMTLREISQKYGFSMACLHYRYESGRRNEELIEPKYKNIVKHNNSNS